jgi:2-amino-4-hydroxy-6-hydroxymethyldihydropteridine diphosphokinase
MKARDVSGPGRRVIAYVGVGSNLDKPAEQVRSAFRELDGIRGTRCVRTSSLYLSSPLGPVEQPDFINAVAVVVTGLLVETLLEKLQAIEDAHGRRRNGTRWGPRPLDLDILLYGDWRMDTARLVVPHPGLQKRSFVLYPLLEVATPDLRIPGCGSLRELVKGCREDNIRRL